MGASSSKAARSAASSSARRKYPSRTPESNPTTNTSSTSPPPAGQPTAPGPTVHPQSQASGSRDESNNTPIAINLDASDPHFAKSLRSLGPVQPSSTLSNSSTFSPTSPSHPSSPPTNTTSNLPQPSPKPCSPNPLPPFRISRGSRSRVYTIARRGRRKTVSGCREDTGNLSDEGWEGNG
ncbi:MAG: hypothetical protein Q9198_003269 [Flavoplaca austrocitrina]